MIKLLLESDKMKSKVYFTKDLSSISLVNIYKQLGINLPERVAVKVH